MIPRTAAELLALTQAGNTFEYLLFYGHKAEPDGTIGAGCLSQFWPAPFTVDGREFASAEHWMMWNKAVLFGDAEAAARVLATASPREAKAIGREVRGFAETVWRPESFAIVAAGNVAKFSQHPELGAFLLGTQKKVLVEASPTDKEWGIGLSKDDPRAQDPATWLGLNMLGFALMDARAELSAHPHRPAPR